MWPALIAAVAALSGVALGALMEPLKPRYARREHIRRERLTQAARLIEKTNLAVGIWATIFRLYGYPKDTLATFGQSRWDGLFETLQEQRNEVRGAASLLELYGPRRLAATARAVADSDLNLSKLSAELGKAAVGRAKLNDSELAERVREAEQIRTELTTALTAFVEAAQVHAR